MSHLPVLPVVLPLGVAALMLLLPTLRAQRVLALAATVTLLVLGAALVLRAEDAHAVYAIGSWPAPFGIVLVVDRAAALLVAVTSVIAIAVLVASLGGWDARGPYYHPLLQLQLAGLNGAFLTGDLFNLFVSFELLLIASFCLLLHGGGRERVRVAVHYVAFNLAASAAFLVGAGLIYGVMGTLNMADIAAGLVQMATDERALVRTGALILLAVFGAKAALFPLSFWLPGTYTAAGAPVAALFAIMTKVGVYAIIRVHLMVFGGEAEGAGGFITPLLLGALATLAVGTLGALAAERLGRIAAYLTIVSVGTMLLGVAVNEPLGLAGALYYLAHSSLALAALFLLVPLFSGARGALGDRLVLGPAPVHPGLAGLLLLLAGAGLAGIPPLSGFFGKLYILQASRESGAVPWIWTALLASGALVIVALTRAGSVLVWAAGERAAMTRESPWTDYAAPMFLVAMTLVLAFGAGPIMSYTHAAARDLVSPRVYIDAVMKP